MAKYEVTTCPVCGVQVEVEHFYGYGHCGVHGEVEPLTVEASPLGPTTAPAWQVRDGMGGKTWRMADSRTGVHFRSSDVLDQANISPASVPNTDTTRYDERNGEAV